MDMMKVVYKKLQHTRHHDKGDGREDLNMGNRAIGGRRCRAR